MASSANGRRLGEIDALRSFAMLSVMAQHSHLLPLGWMGVWLFYVISGYVVTVSILDQHPEAAGPGQLAAFFRRRIARIVPVYYLFILVGLAVALAQGLPQKPLSIASLFLFFDNVTAIHGGGVIRGWPTGHLWTLSVEMQFYALYGVALCLLPRRWTARLLVALLILCPVARFVAGAWLLDSGWRPLDAAYWVYAGPGLHFDIFAMGALLAFARGNDRANRLARPLFGVGVVALGLYALAYVAVNHVLRGEAGLGMLRNVISGILIGEHREALLYTAVGLAMTGLVALAAARDSLVAPLLGLPVLQWIGRISYGGYLFHVLGLGVGRFVLEQFGITVRGGPLWAHALQFPIGLAFTLLLAWLSFHWFETPMRRWLEGRSPNAGVDRARPTQAGVAAS